MTLTAFRFGFISLVLLPNSVLCGDTWLNYVTINTTAIISSFNAQREIFGVEPLVWDDAMEKATKDWVKQCTFTVQDNNYVASRWAFYRGVNYTNNFSNNTFAAASGLGSAPAQG